MRFYIRMLLVAVFTSACSSVFARSMKYGVVAGFRLSRTPVADFRCGFHLGAKGEFNFSDNANRPYLDFGMSLSARGWKGEIAYLGGENDYVDWNCRLYYLEIPLHIGYKFCVNERIKVLANLGPYLAVGLSGKSVIDEENGEPSKENPFKNGMYKRFDVGAGAELGIEVDQRFQIALGYKMGLIRPTKGLWDENYRDRTIGISASYMF